MITLGLVLSVSDMSAQTVSDKNLVGGSKKCESFCSGDVATGLHSSVLERKKAHIDMPVLPLGY